MSKMKRVALAVISLIFLTQSMKCSSDITDTPIVNDSHEMMYGITVDDSWSGEEKLTEIVNAIKAMTVKPTVRIVMNERIAPENYIPTFKAISKVAYVLAQPVDSYYMERFTTVESYLKRFQDSYEHLSEYVDMWEVGNEINGEGWIGDDRQFNADKMYAAYKYIREKGGKTVLVSFESRPEWQEVQMLDWLRTYVPQDMKENLDYMMVSFYEDVSNGYQPNWQHIFEELEEIFPNSFLAIGECGNIADNATTQSRINMARHYYSMPKYVDKYVGGYFWWRWVRECVPHEGNPIWKEINALTSEMQH